jgi:hypothetical protein
VVKEEICDDDMKLPFVNGRAVSWLHQVEESLAGSDCKSQNSFNMQPLGENKVGNQYASMNSVSSQGSSKSNNENVDMRNSRDNSNGTSNRNSKHIRDSNGQIYDTLQNNRKSSKQRHSAVLK